MTPRLRDETQVIAGRAKYCDAGCMSFNLIDLESCFRLEETGAGKELLMKTPELTMIYLSMAPGQGMPLHNHPGCTVAIQGMVGKATVLLAGERHELAPQALLGFSGDQMVSPRNESQAPAAVLITLASGSS